MKMMYLSPTVVSAASAFAAAVIEYIAGDSNFLPPVWHSASTGHARLSYFALMAAALLSAGGTLSASVPLMSEHVPPRPFDGSVPKIVVNPKRTCPSSCVSNPSIAVCSVDHDVSVLVGQTHWLVVRQWNMLPDRSTTR